MPAGRRVVPDSEFWSDEPARRTMPAIIGAFGEPAGVKLMSNGSPPGPGMNWLLMAAGAMLRMLAVWAPKRRQPLWADGCFEDE